MSSIIRSVAKTTRTLSPKAITPRSQRAFRSPFAALGKSPLASSTPPPATGFSSAYEKQTDHSPEPIVSHSGTRTYVVSEPDTSSKFYEVPAGAYHTSAPYNNPAATDAPKNQGAQFGSTNSDPLAHPQQIRAGLQNEREGGVVRNSASTGSVAGKSDA